MAFCFHSQFCFPFDDFLLLGSPSLCIKNAYSWAKYQYKYTLKCKNFVFVLNVDLSKLNEHMHMNIIKNLFGTCVLLSSSKNLFNLYKISPQSYLITIIPARTAVINLSPTGFVSLTIIKEPHNSPAEFKFPQHITIKTPRSSPAEPIIPS